MRSCQNLSISSLLCMFSAILWRRNSMKKDILRAGKCAPRRLAGRAQKPAPLSDGLGELCRKFSIEQQPQ